MRCYLIVGKEASGSRLVSRIFETAGVWAGATDETHDDYHIRKWIGSGEPGGDSFRKFFNSLDLGYIPSIIVYRTHSTLNYHPQLSTVTDKLREVGYEIYWIVTIRRPIRWSWDNSTKPSDIWGSFDNIWKLKQENEQLVFWESSVMFLDPHEYIKEMGQLIGLDLKYPETITNPDVKWITKPEESLPFNLEVSVGDGIQTAEAMA
jgi:hypothetical protein